MPHSSAGLDERHAHSAFEGVHSAEMCRALIASAVATALLACGARTELDRGTDAGMCEWHFGTAIPLVRDLESTPHMSSGAVRRDRDIALVYWRDGHGHVGWRTEVELSEPPRILRESPSSPTEARWVAGAPLGWTEIMLDGERAVMRSADGEVVLELSRPPLSFVETGASVDLVIIGPSGGLELVSLVDGVELERESLRMWHANPRAIRVAAREWIVLGNPAGVLSVARASPLAEESPVEYRIPTSSTVTAWPGSGDMLVLTDGGSSRALHLLSPATLELSPFGADLPVPEGTNPGILFAARSAWLVVTANTGDTPQRLAIVRGEEVVFLDCPPAARPCGHLFGNPGEDVAAMVWGEESDNSLWIAPIRCD